LAIVNQTSTLEAVLNLLEHMHSGMCASVVMHLGLFGTHISRLLTSITTDLVGAVLVLLG
jgi:hypothetical protein